MSIVTETPVSKHVHATYITSSCAGNTYVHINTFHADIIKSGDDAGTCIKYKAMYDGDVYISHMISTDKPLTAQEVFNARYQFG